MGARTGLQCSRRQGGGGGVALAVHISREMDRCARYLRQADLNKRRPILDKGVSGSPVCTEVEGI